MMNNPLACKISYYQINVNILIKYNYVLHNFFPHSLVNSNFTIQILICLIQSDIVYSKSASKYLFKF